VIVNARLAARFWPGESPLDRTVQAVNANGEVTGTMRVIGVAPDLVYEEFGETTPQSALNIYVPYARSGSRTLALLVRASGNPATLADGLRKAVRSVDPSFAAYDVLTMTDRRAMVTFGERFLATTFTVFAVTALLLACLGTYGVVAYAAAQRRREVGVRLAIGAVPTDIVALFVRNGLLLGALGVAIGIPLAAAAAAALSQGDMLFDVSPWDISTWLVLPIALFTAVIVAALQPALRASRLDPAEALRE
jgi:ABC-type antimicrobial peptide transport system permease subunit